MSAIKMTPKVMGVDFREIWEWVDYVPETSLLIFGRGLRLAECASSVSRGESMCSTECHLVIACHYHRHKFLLRTFFSSIYVCEHVLKTYPYTVSAES